jgi:glucose 1-dehydrogenase
MCRNDRYTERGIKERHGFGSELFRNEAAFTVKLDPKLRETGVLMEPTTILAKAWDHISCIGERALWKPKTVLVTGAGPIGLLAALMGKLRGLEVNVLDLVKTGLKPELVHQLGGEYHSGSVDDLKFSPDIIIECTGVSQVVASCMAKIGSDGILCLAGVSSRCQMDKIDLGSWNRRMVLENIVIFGSVNANRRHYELAEKALLQADQDWLHRMISRREPVANWASAIARKPDDIKVVIDFAKN